MLYIVHPQNFMFIECGIWGACHFPGFSSSALPLVLWQTWLIHFGEHRHFLRSRDPDEHRMIKGSGERIAECRKGKASFVLMKPHKATCSKCGCLGENLGDSGRRHIL